MADCALSSFSSVVLAGERAGGNALAQHLGLPSSILAEVGGVATVARVIATLRSITTLDHGVVVGPQPEILNVTPLFNDLFNQHDFAWVAPATGPSASASLGVRELRSLPVLITTADHALLTPRIIEDFCHAADQCNADFVVGLVDYQRVASAYPRSRRTRLRFVDGSYCGANLFWLKSEAGYHVLDFWQGLEQHRKQPWRLAQNIGLGTLTRYLFGSLTVGDAFHTLSTRIGAETTFVEVTDARAAVDVDSVADWRLANQIVASDA